MQSLVDLDDMESGFAGEKKRIVVLGGGFGGAYAAKKLCHTIGEDAQVTLIDRNNFLLFYPLLVEASVGAIEPRHVVAPIRKFLPFGDFRMGEVVGGDLESQQIYYKVAGVREAQSLHYDHLVFALGSVTKIPPIPGLKEHAFELKSLSDGIEMRDRGIRLLEIANNIHDREERRALLRVIVVGANFTGIELAGEYQAFMASAAKAYPNIGPNDVEIKVLEYADRILPAVDEELADYAQNVLTERGLDIRTRTSLSEVGHDFAVLTTGEKIRTHTVIWCAGISPHPLVEQLGLPTNEKGYITCETDLRVKGYRNIWAVGDSATVVDPEGKPYAATAQNATRQGPLVARNILRQMKGEPLEPFTYKPIGAFAAIGHQTAVASAFGRNIKGRLAFVMYRATYLMKIPGLALKARLFFDWTFGAMLPLWPAQLGVRHLPEVSGQEVVAEEKTALL